MLYTFLYVFRVLRVLQIFFVQQRDLFTIKVFENNDVYCFPTFVDYT